MCGILVDFESWLFVKSAHVVSRLTWGVRNRPE